MKLSAFISALAYIMLPAPGTVTVSLGGTVLLMLASGFGVWAGLLLRRRMIRAKKQAAVALAEQKMKSSQHQKRNRVLEKILAVSARLNTTRNPQELYNRTAEAVAEIGRFARVTLYLWSDSTQAFEARGFVGAADPGSQVADEELAGAPVSKEQYQDFCLARNRYSNCYLVGAAAEQQNDFQEDFQGNFASRKAEEPSDPSTWSRGQFLLAPLVDTQGHELGFIRLDEPHNGKVLEVVDLRQLEFLIQQAAISLESLGVYESLARNNAELHQASEKLNSLTDMKNNFVANVSHELRTPLTSISAYTELLQQNMGAMSEDVRKEFLKVIHTESQKLTEIINDILELNNMEQGRPQPQEAQLDIVGLVSRLTDSWSTRAQDQNIALVVETELSNLNLPVDGLLIQQLLAHLLSNAFKFTPSGGQVTVGIEETGTAVRLSVKDSGIGIPEEKLGDIFDRFYQVDGSATRQHNGQGVGLAICQDIVGHHDGRIWAENNVDGGTCITVLLPRRAAVMQPVVPDAVSGNPFQPGEFIQRVMHWVTESLGVQTATLMVPDQDEESLTIRAAVGLPETVVQSARVRRGAGIAGRVWDSGKTLLLEDVTEDEQYGRALSERRYSTSSLLSVPLVHEGRCVGVVSVNNRFDGKPLDQDKRMLLESMAPMLVQMLLRFHSWQEDARHFGQLRDTLRSITAVGHLRQESLLETCQEICLATAREISLPEEDLEHLSFALHFYDVGLAFVPRQLLNKPGPLDPHEQTIVRKHVKKGLRVLEPLDPSTRMRQFILHHHENVDGSGYPVGLAGEAIPLGARLLRLTDTLAALLSTRPWRQAMTLDQAMTEIRSGLGKEYCPRLTDIFLREAELRRERIADQQSRGMDHGVFKRPILDPAQMTPLGV